ncbi:MAG: hypothetical protein ABSD49_14715 [Candidatus Bathyarchaeia archaeon]|jgi:uncharacterized membrane protein (UPF0136 family)
MSHSRFDAVADAVRRNRRLFYPVAVAVAIRVVGAVWFYQLMLTQENTFHFAWMVANPNIIPVGWKWLFLFNGGDSFQFPLIAMKGYAYPVYVFLPAYPVLVWIVGSLVENYWFGAFLVTQAFALGAILVFQLLAERYMDPREALHAALLMATFPYVSVFTTLGYSEAVFLFASISAWYFYRTERLGTSALLAGLTSVSRIYGFAIVLPILLDIVKGRRWRRLLYVAVPVAFIGAWTIFCYATTGDLLASWTDEWKFYAVAGANMGLVQTIFSQLAYGLPSGGLDPAILVSVALFAFLVVRVWKIDHSLWAYALTMFGVLIFIVPSHITLLRYLAFVFPIWLTVKIKNPIAVAACVALFVPIGLLLWLYAITVFFVG